MKIKSFPPLSSACARVLILGSMPGVKSLEEGQYYANPKNAFWPILFTVLGQNFSAHYKDKQNLIINNSLALWDVLAACTRPGSLDSNITEEKPNDINAFINANTHITAVFFNGQTAEKMYDKFFKRIDGVSYISLPSTSPAHAALTYEGKLMTWTAAFKNFLKPPRFSAIHFPTEEN